MASTVLKNGKFVFIAYTIHIYNLVFFVETWGKNDTTLVYQILTSNWTYGKNEKMAPVYRILILQQIKLEKNAFHSLKERQISFHSIYTIYIYNLAFCWNLREK